MRRVISALLTVVLLTAALVTPASGAGDKGKANAHSAFRTLGTGSAVLDFGAALNAAPIAIPASSKMNSVRVFPYEDSPSDGVTFCGDVWLVLVSVQFDFDKPGFDGIVSTFNIEGGPYFPATDKTPIRSAKGTTGTDGLLIRAYGAYLAPGTLEDGWNTIGQARYGDPWGPWVDDATIYVSDSAC